MILRHLERKPVQALLSIFGISLAVSILVLGSFSEDAVFYLMDFQFSLSQRQNVTVTFVEPASAGAVHDLKHLPGVWHCEPFRSVPVRLRFEHRARRLSLMGLASERHLNRVLYKDEQGLKLTGKGLVLSAKLAEILCARPGDVLTVEVLEVLPAAARCR